MSQLRPASGQKATLSCASITMRSGSAEHDSRALSGLLTLEGFQAGLAWITVLRKRDAFRKAFRGFDPKLVAKFGEKDVTRLLADPGIIRSRSKIEATIEGARIYERMKRDGGKLL